MEVRVTIEPDDAAHVAFVGDIDIAARPAVRAAEMRIHGAASVVIDLGGVTFVDGGGLRVILDLARHLERRGAAVEIAASSLTVDRYLELTHSTLP